MFIFRQILLFQIDVQTAVYLKYIHMNYKICIISPLVALFLVISNTMMALADETKTDIEPLFNYEQKEFSSTASDLAEETTADEDDTIVPTDPTNIIPSLTFSYERTEFSDAQGDSNILAVEGWIPLSNRDLLTIEAKLVNIHLSSTADDIAQGDGLSFFDQSEARGIDATNIGDTRLRYFHLIPVENGGIFRAWAPSLDTSIPTGSSDDGTGGDYWIIAPNVVLAFDLSESISAYTFFRYVQGFATNSQPDINGINIEVPISFAFSEVTFLTLTPNFFHDFGESDTSFLTGKVGLTQMLSDSVGATIEVNLPIAGESGIDYSIKPSIFIYL